MSLENHSLFLGEWIQKKVLRPPLPSDRGAVAKPCSGGVRLALAEVLTKRGTWMSEEESQEIGQKF